MTSYTIPQTDLTVSRIAYGCMHLGGRGRSDAEERAAAAAAIDAAVAGGITLFDHADIYGRGRSEAVFGAVMQERPGLRDRVVLQTKAGIRFAGDPHPDAPKRYDFSYGHLVRSVEESLRRLRTDYVDVFLLHRPDPLAEPEEIARAFDALHASGKVRHFGVSNHTAGQVELLRAYVRQPLVVNQVELSLLHPHLIYEGVVANRAGAPTALATGTLDYCRRAGLLVQAWSPVGGGALFAPPAMREAPLQTLVERVEAVAEAEGVTAGAILLAWLLRHPAGIQPVIGTTNPERVRASCEAAAVSLSREAWYALLEAACGAEVP
ncbi:MAG: aldo/keto reductase [Rhodothermales bacterium]|nr:aldo/keto reductase [Rhodothermales bacterium]